MGLGSGGLSPKKREHPDKKLKHKKTIEIRAANLIDKLQWRFWGALKNILQPSKDTIVRSVSAEKLIGILVFKIRYSDHIYTSIDL
jgi:hypothetical protein